MSPNAVNVRQGDLWLGPPTCRIPLPGLVIVTATLIASLSMLVIVTSNYVEKLAGD